MIYGGEYGVNTWNDQDGPHLEFDDELSTSSCKTYMPRYCTQISRKILGL